MKQMHSRQAFAMLAISAAALLSACGSGSEIAAPSVPPPSIALAPGTDVPLSATQSSAQATDFVRTVVSKGEADSEAALVVNDVVLATSETDDPAPV